MTYEERKRRIAELREELSRLEEEQARDILAQTNGSLTEQVKAFLKEKRLIGAIKHYREVTGCMLHEAKAAVEEIKRGT